MTDFSFLLSCNNNFVYFTRSKLPLFLKNFPIKNSLINSLMIKFIKIKYTRLISDLVNEIRWFMQ